MLIHFTIDKKLYKGGRDMKISVTKPRRNNKRLTAVKFDLESAFTRNKEKL